MDDAVPSYTAGTSPSLGLKIAGLALELDAHFKFKVCATSLCLLPIRGEGTLVATINGGSFSASQFSGQIDDARGPY